jgi:hypothetical protein
MQFVIANKKRTIITAISLIFVIAAITGVILYLHWQTTHTVERIFLFKWQQPQPPTGAIYATAPTNPYTNQVELTVYMNDRLFFFLRTSHHIKNSITFTKFTYYNTTLKAETQMGSTSDLGPYFPDELYLVAFNDPWPVPETPGVYQLRVYVGNKVVAWALFEVH